METDNKNNSKKYEIMKDKDEILEGDASLAEIHADREFVSDIIRRMIYVMRLQITLLSVGILLDLMVG